MSDDTGKLYLFEALELRRAFDTTIRLLERLVNPAGDRRDTLFGERDTSDRRPASGFDLNEAEGRLKRLRVKPLKLNEAIQVANFRSQIVLDGEEPASLARALEMRKALLQDIEQLAERALEAAYVRVIHKEERDIERVPPRPFVQVLQEFEEARDRLRKLLTALHRANHEVTVDFRDD